MLIELTQNVVIDGKTHLAGSTIDTKESGVCGESIVGWGWGKEKKAKKVASEPAAPTETDPTDNKNDTSTPTDVSAPTDLSEPVTKPSRKKK